MESLLLSSLFVLGVSVVTVLVLRKRERPRAEDYIARTVFDTGLRNAKIGVFFGVLLIIMSLVSMWR